jgi:hypothetical protein
VVGAKDRSAIPRVSVLINVDSDRWDIIFSADWSVFDLAIEILGAMRSKKKGGPMKAVALRV